MCFGGGGGAPLPTPQEKEIDFGPLPSLRVTEDGGERIQPQYRNVARPEMPQRQRRTSAQRRSLFTTGEGLMRYD